MAAAAAAAAVVREAAASAVMDVLEGESKLAAAKEEKMRTVIRLAALVPASTASSCIAVVIANSVIGSVACGQNVCIHASIDPESSGVSARLVTKSSQTGIHGTTLASLLWKSFCPKP